MQTKWDPDNLHRHPDFRPVKEEPVERSLSSHASLPQLRKEWAADTDDSRATSTFCHNQHELKSLLIFLIAFTGDPEDEFGSETGLSSHTVTSVDLLR